MVFLLIKFLWNSLSLDYRDSPFIATTTPFSSFVVPAPGMGVSMNKMKKDFIIKNLFVNNSNFSVSDDRCYQL